MVAPLTPKPTRKAEALAKAPPTIASRREDFSFGTYVSFFFRSTIIGGGKKKGGKTDIIPKKEVLQKSRLYISYLTSAQVSAL
jgi:hypothetical protein